MMASKDKLFSKMRSNPRGDWRIKDLETIAKRYDITIRKSGGSHVVFNHPYWVELLCIPAHRPIKAIYIKKFISLVELLEKENESNRLSFHIAQVD